MSKNASLNANGIPPVAKINGSPISDYLNVIADAPPYHEIDARYNRLFPSQPGIAWNGNIGNTFSIDTNPPDGPTTLLEFADGSQKLVQNYAKVLNDFTGVTDGASFFQKFCTVPLKTAVLSSTESQTPEIPTPQETSVPTPEPKPTQTSYPDSAFVLKDGSFGGYFLSEPGYDDTAVLALPTFEPKDTLSWQDMTVKFLAQCRALGKKKLIIDIRHNGGGYVKLGYDLFHQLFPTLPFAYLSNYRQSPLFAAEGQILTAFLQNFTRESVLALPSNSPATTAIQSAWGSDWNYKRIWSQADQPFQSAEQFFGPVITSIGGQVTALTDINLSDGFSSPGINVTGYQDRKSLLNLNQPFASENIVLIQDGGCGSTCAIFSELMKVQGKVQQVVFGGLPRYGPMQGVTGSKGSQVLTLDVLYNFFSGTIQAINTPGSGFDANIVALANSSPVGAIANATTPLTRAAKSADGKSVNAGVNWKNHVRGGDTTLTPVEFIYEAADCRLFYTLPMVQDVTKVWKAAFDAYWKKQGCVPGSTGHPSSLSGGSNMYTTQNSTTVVVGGGNGTTGVNVPNPVSTGPIPFTAAGSVVRVEAAAVAISTVLMLFMLSFM
jgi:hypothetical protein